MVDAIKSIVKRVSGVFRAGNVFDGGYWPAGVLNQLETQYQLNPDDMLRLGCLRNRISGKKSSTYSLLIYDRLAAHNRQLSVRNVNDIYNTPSLLLYKGNMDENGSIHLVKVSKNESN
ncbi:hypothetical protein ACFLXP_04495 [Chloroflexota bacterium]